MLEKLYDDVKNEFDSTIKKLVLTLEKRTDEAWAEAMDGLREEKLTLESDIERIEKDRDEKQKELSSLSKEVIELSEARNKERASLNVLTERQTATAEKLIQAEQGIAKITEREQAVEKKEQEQRDRDMALKAREINITERHRRLKQMLEKYK